MDDQRLVRTLRTIDRPEAPDPAFLDGLYENLAADLGFRGSAAGSVSEHRARSDRLPTTSAASATAAAPSRTAGVLARLPLAAALGAAAVTGAIAAAAVLRPEQPTRPSLLDVARDRGSLTIAVSSGRPQARSPRGVIGGFDSDVGLELGRRLGLGAVVTAVGGSLETAGVDWQVALPATGLDAGLRERYAVSRPISWWPAYLIVPTDSAVVTVADLAGSSICVVAGSTGEDWLRQAPVRSATPTVPAPAATATTLPDDDACLDALAAGAVQAAVTASIDPAGLATRGDVRAVGGPVLTEERGAVIDPFAGDPAELLAAIDTAIEAARADGTLADLARARFGGVDLAAPPADLMEEP